MRDLGAPAGRAETDPVAINDRGQVVADSYRSELGNPVAFVSDSGTITKIPPLRGMRFSAAAAINDRGHVVGDSYGKTDEYGEPLDAHAFVWARGTVTELPSLPGARSSSATGINDDDEIVGSVTTKTGHAHAVLWTLRR